MGPLDPPSGSVCSRWHSICPNASAITFLRMKPAHGMDGMYPTPSAKPGSCVHFSEGANIEGGRNCLSLSVIGALGALTWGFAFLKEKGLGKSNGSPKREVVFALGNSSTGGITGMMGDGGESAGRVSSVSGGWGIFICRSPWLDKFSSSLTLPCSDKTRGGVNTLPCSDKTTGLDRILPCSNETWDSNNGELDRGAEFDAGGTAVRSPGPGSNFLPRGAGGGVRQWLFVNCIFLQTFLKT
jgi:hypothetical protein